MRVAFETLNRFASSPLKYPTIFLDATIARERFEFTSRRLYGNVATVNPWWSDPRWAPIGGQFGPTTKKIWVTAVDSDAIAKAGAGTDPSHPPFYLPGQELLAGNAKAYWSIPACVHPSSSKTGATLCDSNLDCCGGTAAPALFG